MRPAPVEQAGGDERDFQAEGAQEVPSPVSQEYDRHLISLLRKGEALPGHQEEAADEIERLRDWNDHLNNTVLPNILNPTFLMLMKGGERLLDLCTKDGEFIGVSLNDMKDVFDWMVTHARIAPDQAALAQPSHAPELAERGTQHRFSTTEQTCRHDFAGVWWNDNGVAQTGRECRHCGFFVADVTKAQAEQAEAERPEVVATMYTHHDDVDFREFVVVGNCDKGCEGFYGPEKLMTVAQHERIVGELRADRDSWAEQAEQRLADWDEMRKERDAALARVAGLRSLLNPILCYVENDIERMRGDRDKSDNKEIYDLAISLAMERLKAAQHAVFTTEPGCDTAVELASHITAQAQHSVPETINEEANSFLRIADAGQFKDNAVAVRTAAVIIRGLLHRPPLMQSIIRHRIGLTPEYEGQWHADLYGEDGEVQHHAAADTPDEAVRAVVALAAAPGKEVGHE